MTGLIRRATILRATHSPGCVLMIPAEAVALALHRRARRPLPWWRRSLAEVLRPGRGGEARP